MKIQDAYISINNLDLKESIRKFSSSWSYVFVNEHLEVVAVVKYKNDLSDIEEKKLAENHTGCILIIARPGDYASEHEFRERVRSCKNTFEYIRNNL